MSDQFICPVKKLARLVIKRNIQDTKAIAPVVPHSSASDDSKPSFRTTVHIPPSPQFYPCSLVPSQASQGSRTFHLPPTWESPHNPCDKCGCDFCCLCSTEATRLMNKRYWSTPQFRLNVCIGFSDNKVRTRLEIIGTTEQIVLFNDVLNIFNFLYDGHGHMVNSIQKAREKTLLLPLLGLLFSISSKQSFICTIPQIG